MPTYEYACSSCKHEWELEQSIKDNAITECPHCHAQTAKRQISRGTGFILKGGGWYADLYSSPSGNKPAESKDGASSSASTKDSGGSSGGSKEGSGSSGGDSSGGASGGGASSAGTSNAGGSSSSAKSSSSAATT